MSRTHQSTFLCGGCGAPIEARVADSVNAGRHAHMREAILQRSFHAFACDVCQAMNTVEKEFLYVDLDRRELYGVFPVAARARERACAEQVADAFEAALGSGASSPVAAWGRQFQCRVCFGLEELREKIVAHAAGLSDLALEALKATILRERPDLAEALVQTLRLDAVMPADGSLVLLLEHAGDPPRIDQGRVISVDRAVYDAIAQRSWQDILADLPGLASGPHVSLLRLVSWADAPAGDASAGDTPGA